jgi:Ca2+-binding RTX toxin-like protein
MGRRRDLVSVAVVTMLLGSAAASAATIGGTRGPDLLRGTPRNDSIYGRGGNDTLFGLAGNDVLSGGRGRDKIDGGTGDDRLLARDQVRDTIRCGAGADVVVADRVDSVPGTCESILRPRTTAPPPPSPPPLQDASFSGTGNAQHDVALAPGYDLIAAASHSGSSTFVVSLAAASRETRVLFNQVGAYTGRRADTVTGGRYRLVVEASGPWRVDLDQPAPGPAERPLIGTFAGSGDEVIPVYVATPGTYVASAEFSAGADCTALSSAATCTFVVELRRNPERQLIFASVGPSFSGRHAIDRPLQAGGYLLSVRGTTSGGMPGTWSVTFTG